MRGVIKGSLVCLLSLVIMAGTLMNVRITETISACSLETKPTAASVTDQVTTTTDTIVITDKITENGFSDWRTWYDNLISECPSSGKCALNGTICPSTSMDESFTLWVGSISIARASNFQRTQLDYFCTWGIPEEYRASLIRADNESTDILCHHSYRDRQVQELFPRSGREENSPGPFILLPSHGLLWPFHTRQFDFLKYSSAILYDNDFCFWPTFPENVESAQNISVWNHILAKEPLHVETAVISGGVFENFWHAMYMYNDWCRYRNDTNISFLVQFSARTVPTHMKTWSKALGIAEERILVHDRPVVAENIMGTSFIDVQVDWSCLHGVFGERAPMTSDPAHALIYTRVPPSPKDRNIPMRVSAALAQSIRERFPEMPVKYFRGDESFEETHALFSNARIVIGPHGAGLANLVLCRSGTPVVEFLWEQMFRPWQFFGGMTIDLPWWPVMVENVKDEKRILGAIEVIELALRRANATIV